MKGIILAGGSGNQTVPADQSDFKTDHAGLW